MALRGGLSLKIERGCLKVHLCKQNITKIFNGFNDIMANGVGSSGRVLSYGSQRPNFRSSGGLFCYLFSQIKKLL